MKPEWNPLTQTIKTMKRTHVDCLELPIHNMTILVQGEVSDDECCVRWE